LLDWEEESREKQSSFGIFDVYSVRRAAPSGQRGNFIIVDAPDWVTVVPLARNESGEPCFVMVRQYRHGSRRITLEFPAGVIERNEEPEEAAARELEEETGRRAKSITLLGEASPNPAFMCNRTFTYLATGVGLPGAQALDELEDVEVELIPVDVVVAEMGTGSYDNTIMMAALAYYLRWEASQSNHTGKRSEGG